VHQPLWTTEDCWQSDVTQLSLSLILYGNMMCLYRIGRKAGHRQIFQVFLVRILWFPKK